MGFSYCNPGGRPKENWAIELAGDGAGVVLGDGGHSETQEMNYPE